MQLQCDVGVFRRILRGTLDRHLVETDLVCAFAGDLFKRNRFHAEMAGREIVHVVRLVAFKHVRLQQSVVQDTPEVQTVIGKHVSVVFEILADLVLVCVF